MFFIVNNDESFRCERGGGVMIDTMAKDVSRAVRWGRDNAARLGGDPTRISLVGHSAGAHLVALITVSKNDEFCIRNKGLCIKKRGILYQKLMSFALIDRSAAPAARRTGTRRY